MRVFTNATVLVASLYLAIAPAWPETAAEYKHNALYQKDFVSSKARTHPEMPLDAEEIAVITGIMPIYEALKVEQVASKGIVEGDYSPKAITHRQKIIYLRTKINQYLESASLDVNSVLGQLDSGSALLAHDKATINDERARILRRNSFINLFSGGITKIGGYSSALTPASLIPTNVLEVFDGGVQSGLSALTLRQQHNEGKLMHSAPPILTTFASGSIRAREIYPESVWNYLNATVGNGPMSRRLLLIKHWSSVHKTTSKITGASSTSTFSSVVRMDLNDLDQTVAMLTDLKSLIGGMNQGLVELSQVIKRSYDDDPGI
jgi:hypothetical protein